MTDFDVGWYEYLGEPLGARLHVRTYLFGIARVFGATRALITRDNETALATMFDRQIGWEQALAAIDWPHLDASFEELCTADAHGESLWLDSFDDFVCLPGDDLTRARANLRLGDLGIEPLRLRPERGSPRLLTPMRRWEYREDYYDEDRGLDIPLVPQPMAESPLSAELLQLLDGLAAYLGETLVTYGIDLRDGRRTDRIAGVRLDGTRLIISHPGASGPRVPAPGDYVDQEVELVVRAPSIGPRDALNCARDALLAGEEWVVPRCVHVETSAGYVTVPRSAVGV